MPTKSAAAKKAPPTALPPAAETPAKPAPAPAVAKKSSAPKAAPTGIDAAKAPAPLKAASVQKAAPAQSEPPPSELPKVEAVAEAVVEAAKDLGHQVDAEPPAAPQAIEPAAPQVIEPATPQAIEPAAPQVIEPAAPQAIEPSVVRAEKPEAPLAEPPIVAEAKPATAETAPAPVHDPVPPPAPVMQTTFHRGPMMAPGGRVMPPPRIPAKAEIFEEGDHVVYPTHGVGKVERIATEEIAGHKLELIHITFEENRMTLRVPVAKARTAGLRKLATRKMFDEALAVLRGRARIKRTMWSRRAQEYEAKINSGDPLAIAEVVRDLHRNAGQPDQSFSERQIYEAAMDRLAAELAALDRIDKAAAAVKLAEFLKTVV